MRLCLLGDQLLIDADSIVAIYPDEDGLNTVIEVSFDNRFVTDWTFLQVAAALEVFYL